MAVAHLSSLLSFLSSSMAAPPPQPRREGACSSTAVAAATRGRPIPRRERAPAPPPLPPSREGGLGRSPLRPDILVRRIGPVIILARAGCPSSLSLFSLSAPSLYPTSGQSQIARTVGQDSASSSHHPQIPRGRSFLASPGSILSRSC